MNAPPLALLVLAGFVDDIAGGGGRLTLLKWALAGLDPVAAVATNKLAGAFGGRSPSGGAGRSGKIQAAMNAVRARRGPGRSARRARPGVDR